MYFLMTAIAQRKQGIWNGYWLSNIYFCVSFMLHQISVNQKYFFEIPLYFYRELLLQKQLM